VDANRSAVVVAPTASGKTFISYYCIKRVLGANLELPEQERGVVVYVAPTNALMMQVAAEIYGKYGPVFGVWNDEVGTLICQILLTTLKHANT
jgi:replicative superfamily II helicase